MSTSLEKSVERLSLAVFGRFDRKAWEDTRPPAFASKYRINRLRARHRQKLLSDEAYEAARAAYYERHPDARR